MADKTAVKRMEWSEELVVDGSIIDRDHKTLIELINDFNENVPNFSKPEDLSPYLLSLKKYTQTHFGREERLQRSAHYHLHEEHLEEHRDMVAQLDKMIEKAEAADGEKITPVAVEIATFLTDTWLVNHIMVNDMPMRPYVDSMREEAEGMLEMRG